MFDVLCLCTGNICRSPMAEGLLKFLLPDALRRRVNIHSAGTHAIADNVPEENAVIAMRSFGVDISRHRARLIDDDAVKNTDLLLAMEKRHIHMIRGTFNPHRNVLHLLAAFNPGGTLEEIDDPYGKPLTAYLNCAHDIRSCLTGVIRYLSDIHGIKPNAR